MKLLINHYGRVRNGELIYSLPELLDQNIRELEGSNFVMTLKKQHEKPSISQYGFYRGCILICCHKSEAFVAMDTKDSIHEKYFAPRFLSYKTIAEVSGKRYEVTLVRSLADLSKEEMSEFLERVIAHCEELGISVPPPELFYQKYYQK